jgi:hypothetical protein
MAHRKPEIVSTLYSTEILAPFQIDFETFFEVWQLKTKAVNNVMFKKMLKFCIPATQFSIAADKPEVILTLVLDAILMTSQRL